MPLDRSLDQADEVCGKILRLDQTLLPAQPNQRRLVIAHVEIGASDFYQRDGVGTSLDVGKADSANVHASRVATDLCLDLYGTLVRVESAADFVHLVNQG
jgi:hypothetical protein